MKLVLDSSVALKWVLAEPDSARANQLRQEAQAGQHELLAPDVFPVELAHALTKAERQGRILPPMGGIFWHDIMTTPPQFFASLPLIPRAYAIASPVRIGVYDCLYVALAEQEGCQLVTADDRLVKALQPHFPFVVSLASLP